MRCRRDSPGASLPLNRRRLVQAGALGMIGLGLPEFLAGRAAARAGDARAGDARGPERSCIFVVQYGGASHIDTLDPKPEAPEEIRGPYKPIATPVPGIQLTDMLPQLAGLSPLYTIVRSMSHRTSDHNGGMHVCMTGRSKPAEQSPYFGSVAAKLSPAVRNVPSYVWLQNLAGDVLPWYLTGGFLGAAYGPMVIGKDEDNPAKSDFRMREFEPADGVTSDRIIGRRKLLDEVVSPLSNGFDSGSTRAFQRFQERAVELVTSPQAHGAFNLTNEPDSVRDRYGRHVLGQNLLLARRLVEAGVRLVTVNAWCGRASTSDVLATQGWDHHGADIQKCGIFDTGTFSLGFVLPRFDQAISALLEDLHQRGLLESTLVAVVGEFGRTPRIVKSPYPGRDHWPQCYSALLAGAGIRGGAVYGSSDRHGGYVKSLPVSPEDFGATLFHAIGIAPHTRFGPDGFSERVSNGQPITELFG